MKLWMARSPCCCVRALPTRLSDCSMTLARLFPPSPFSANRAACHLKLENFGTAIADASEAIKRVRCPVLSGA